MYIYFIFNIFRHSSKWQDWVKEIRSITPNQSLSHIHKLLMHTNTWPLTLLLATGISKSLYLAATWAVMYLCLKCLCMGPRSYFYSSHVTEMPVPSKQKSERDVFVCLIKVYVWVQETSFTLYNCMWRSKTSFLDPNQIPVGVLVFI
jgi:hypothetical protein